MATIRKAYVSYAINHIGIAGTQGFGVGVCPSLPSGMSPMGNSYDPASDNYGNYQFSDGSAMCWIPRFYYKVGTGSNGLAVNVVSIKSLYDYPTTALANAAGYALHRAFIDGGREKSGFFVDKYKCSKNALGTGFIASSIKNGNPLSTAAAHNPLLDLTAAAANNYANTITVAHARDGINGAVNAASIFFQCSRFIRGALALLALAHGQASISTTYCAWYSAGTTNFPKGCNNNALRDVNDTSVIWQSDDYSNCGKTGSAGYGGGAGNLFAKSTHNGQSCGVADLNGLMFEVDLGVTCIAASKSITAATQANPCQITISGHGYSDGDLIQITSVAGMTQLNDKIYSVTTVDANNFTIGVDSSVYGAYTSGGTVTRGVFSVAKQSTAMKDFGSGNTLATDHWGATGVAAMMEPLSPAFATGGAAFVQLFGNGSNQVLSEALAGNAWVLAGLGFPGFANAVSPGGQAVFGLDYYYQYIVNELCLLACGLWGDNSSAGVWNVAWFSTRADSNNNVGCRLACYLV